MIPEYFDARVVIEELKHLGWKDYAIENECGMTKGYLAQVRCGNVRLPSYTYAAKMLNLLERAREQHLA